MLTATLRALQQEAHDARQAGDKEAFLRKLDAAEMEAARIVVSVRGPQIAAHVIEQAGPRFQRLRRLIEEAAKQGKDVAPLVKLGEQAGQLHKEAAAALERGKPVVALRLGAKAIDLLARF